MPDDVRPAACHFGLPLWFASWCLQVHRASLTKGCCVVCAGSQKPQVGGTVARSTAVSASLHVDSTPLFGLCREQAESYLLLCRDRDRSRSRDRDKYVANPRHAYHIHLPPPPPPPPARGAVPSAHG